MRRDRGSVTIWAAATIAAIWLVVTVAYVHGAAVIGRHGAETAADLAALAAAVHTVDGDVGACVAAARVAGLNGGVLTGCRVAGADVEVTVSRAVRLAGLGVRTATARARAGPADRAPP